MRRHMFPPKFSRFWVLRFYFQTVVQHILCPASFKSGDMEVLEARGKMACSLYPWKGQIKTIKGSEPASARCDEQKDGKKPGVTGVQRGSCTDELTMIVRARTGLCQLKPEKISARRQVVTSSPPLARSSWWLLAAESEVCQTCSRGSQHTQGYRGCTSGAP